MIPMAILCGGRGTRLGPLTHATPKSLMDVNGKPFLIHQLELLKRHGYTEIVLLAGHLWEQIRKVAGNGKKLGMKIDYAFDGETPLGTDGAITRALPMLSDLFFVLYGDSYLECDYAHIEQLARDYVFLDAILTTYEGVDYGLRSFRQFPPQTWMEVPMPHRWEEIGSPEGLERVRAITR
jgi:NDP-sugar pyrophosphorylase family protein